MDNPHGKKCFRCNKIFDCKQNADTCWCKDVIVTEDVLDSIRIEGTDCLCETCLSHLSSKNQ